MGVHFDRALLLFERGRHEQAEAELRQELAERPDHALTHSMIALCRRHRLDMPGALDWATRAVGLDPEEGYTHYALAIVLGYLKRPVAAGRSIREAIRLDTTKAVYHFELACMESNRGDNQKSLIAADRGLAVDPRHAECLAMRALSLARLKRRREAEDAISAALAADPESDFVRAAEGWKRLCLGDGRGAREHFREALRINPQNRWAKDGLEGPTLVDRGIELLIWVAILGAVSLPCVAAIWQGRHETQGTGPVASPPTFSTWTAAMILGSTILWISSFYLCKLRDDRAR